MRCFGRNFSLYLRLFLGLAHPRQRFVRRCHGRKKAPTIKGRGKLSRAGSEAIRPFPLCTKRDCRAEHPSVALPTSWVLFICAKNLLVEATAPQPWPQNF